MSSQFCKCFGGKKFKKRQATTDREQALALATPLRLVQPATTPTQGQQSLVELYPAPPRPVTERKGEGSEPKALQYLEPGGGVELQDKLILLVLRPARSQEWFD